MVSKINDEYVRDFVDNMYKSRSKEEIIKFIVNPFNETIKKYEKIKEMKDFFNITQNPIEIAMLFFCDLILRESDIDSDYVKLLMSFLKDIHIMLGFGLTIISHSKYITKQGDGKYMVLKPSVVDSKKVE